MTDGTSKLVNLRPVKSVHVHETIDLPAISAPERDSFVAETAVKFDQLQASHRLLAREVADLANRLAEVEEVAGQDHRLHAFQQSECRAKEGKLEDVVRRCRDLKARLDRIEAHGDSDYHAYNSFAAVSRKLAELERPRRNVRRWLFRGSLVIVAVISVGLLLPHTQF
jgi:hypothetical protein